MSHNDKPPSGYPPFRQLIPVPDVDDDEIDAAAGLLQEFFSAVDFSFEEDVLTYYSPPPSPRGEPERPEVIEVPHREQVQVMAEDRGDQPQDFIQEDFDENELIYALDALEEDEGEQRPVHVQLLDDDDTEILDLGLLQINPTPSHSRDPVAPQLESEGEVLVPSSPLQSMYLKKLRINNIWFLMNGLVLFCCFQVSMDLHHTFPHIIEMILFHRVRCHYQVQAGCKFLVKKHYNKDRWRLWNLGKWK